MLFAETTLPPLLVDIPKFLQFKKQHQFKNGYSTITTDCAAYLNPQALEVFCSLGLEPEVIVAFGHENNPHFSPRILVHRDVQLVDTTWYPVPCSLNCEIVGGATFTWYDTGKLKPIPPEVATPTTPTDHARYALGNGYHYGSRYRFGTSGCTEIGSLVFQPGTTYLINTSVPHAVHYHNLANRLNISLRFKDSPSLEDMYEMLSMR